MSNEDILREVVKSYFSNQDWKGYLNKKVRESKKLEELLKNIV